MENKSFSKIANSIYLYMNNPWRWSNNIEYNMEKAIEKDFFQMFKEICFFYHQGLNRDEKSFQWYFEEVFEKRITDPQIETKKYGSNGEGIADFFVENRKKHHNQNMDDYKKIFLLWKIVGIKKGFDVSFYPDDLDEIFN